MAGYSNNYGSGYAGGSGGNPPEYQDKPNADSVNGTYGTNTPAARNNQQQQRQGGNGNGNGNGNSGGNDPYAAFHEASKGWWNRPAAPVPVPSPTSNPSAVPAPVSAPVRALSSPLADTLRGTSSAPASAPAPAPNSSPANLAVSEPDTVAVSPNSNPNAGNVGGPMPPVSSMASTNEAAPPPSSPPAVIPPLPVDSSHPLHPDFLASTLVSSQSINGGTPDDGTGNLNDNPTTPSNGSQPPPPVYSATNPPPKPPNTEDPAVAAAWYQKFSYLNPAFANITPADVSAYRGNPQGMSFGDWYTAKMAGGNPTGNPPDNNTPAPSSPLVITPPSPPSQNQTPVYSDANPPPKPPGTEDPNIAAAWYQKFAYKNPAFANITADDVTNQRMLATGGKFAAMGHPEWNDFGTWYAAGKPGGNYQDGAGNGNGNGNENGNGNGNGNGDGTIAGTTAGTSAPPPPVTTPPVTSPATPPATPPVTLPVTPPAVPPPASLPAPNSDDALSRTQRLYNPLFKQQQDDLARTLRAQGALDGSGDSGGFAESFGRSEARLSADQGAQLAGLTEAQQNRDQAMTIAVMNDATQRYGIKTNDDLQRWLNDPKNDTLQKYGIDKNDLMERYKAELGLQGSELVASASFNGAALQAATSKAIAEGNNATQLSLGTMQNNLGYGQLQGNLYNADQDRIVQEMQMLINAGVTPAVAAQIAASFGPSAPVYKP